MSRSEEAEWAFGKSFGKFRVHRSFDPRFADEPYSISWDEQWLEGVFATVDEALESGRLQVHGMGA